MHSQVEEVITKIPAWKDADNLQVEPLAGLNNTNYLVTVNGDRYVLRVSGQNTVQLGINREYEFEVLSAVSKAGIGAHVEYSILPEGHLVTRFINGHHFSLEEYRKPENIQRIVKTLKRLHKLPLPKTTFSPFGCVESYTEQAQSMRVPFPQGFDKLRKKMEKIEQEQARDTSPWQGFCHNDLFFVNVLDDGKIRFIDWEFSGAGDIYYDLATLTYAYDSPDSLPRSLQEYMLACYFGEVKNENWTRLQGMKFMVMFFTAMWGLLQQGMQNEGLIREIEGFNYLKYANVTFETMKKLFR